MLTQSQVADKIRKLLALADGAGTEAEATNAATRAAALMAQYQIQECDVDALVQDAQDPLTIVETGAADRIMGWRKLLAQGIAGGCGCYALTYLRRGKGSSLVFSGRTSAVETALYMFAALSSEIERLAKRNAGGKGASFVNAYKLGMTSRISQRLREQRTETIEQARTAANSSALVRVSDAGALAKAHLLAPNRQGDHGSDLVQQRRRLRRWTARRDQRQSRRRGCDRQRPAGAWHGPLVTSPCPHRACTG
jgi:hypothetical protein